MSNQKIQSTIDELLKSLCVNVDGIDIEESELHPIFLVRSPDSKILIGSGGENLRALNYLVKKIVEKNIEGDHKFLIDVNGYHGKKLEELKQQARILAERARTFRHDVELSPMNAYERMVIHSLIGEDPDLSTESEGEGKFRRVVIRYNAKDLNESD
ncbi:hypothetical protein CL631_02570 [bacterium]|jgi:spoIIIJ-associated protein|nr:hypothetical protein [bacterium]MDP6659779.1 R3H domain-containing nucleic acid-binding protein [Candidatus Paceibacterota bacterium]